MSSKSIGRGAASARTLRVWSTVTLATLVLAACGGGGGGDSAPPPQNPPPSNPPPPPPPPPTSPTNAAPVVTVGADQAFDLPTDTAALSGSATDDGQPAGSSISYTWEVVSGPLGPNSSPGVVFDSANSQNTNARFVGGVGEYTLNLKASDGALEGTATTRVTVRSNPNLYPGAGGGSAGWTTATPADEQMDVAKLDEARDYSITSATTPTVPSRESGFIIRHGRLVYSWGDPATKYEMKSTTKSMGGLALLLALDEGKLALTDKASDRLPVFGTDPPVTVTAGSLSDITLLQLSTHTSGFSKPDESNWELRFAPGTTWSYSDQGLNWLADVLTTAYAQDLNALVSSRVFSQIGIATPETQWRTNVFRSTELSVNGAPVPRRELASGLNASVNAMARVGLLMLRKGVWGDNLILSNSVVSRAHTPPSEVAGATINDPVNFPQATENYGVLWWTNANGQMPDVPVDAYWAWGLHDTLIIIVPSLDLVIARAGDRGWRTQDEFWNADYAALSPFLTPIVQSITP